ncbi:hypothetical protein VSS74_26440 [Conexibacter stalactiti]|uniref:Uncharacterized protein n=1 Tax=Conexibacter stalactiti TaxID=1940611 RepID=A0ABU4HX71_9ACTN|nr:hypothetical protein [Conexibacter stalactiti]MDW5597921.1 hypothetical protein [Conexibacter stalactiti]MEC5038563.1 hypothetical protein [Conexibacter stalactiti]
MERVIEQASTQVAPPPGGFASSHLPSAPWFARDERAARRTLRGQVRKLERELAEAVARTVPGDEIIWTLSDRAAAPAGPRLLSLGELERLRDELAERLHEVRVVHAERAEREALKRDELARLLRDPAAYPGVRITRREVGEPGCGAWESRPRLGLIGMLAGWWHVKISSGCPLARARRRS